MLGQIPCRVSEVGLNWLFMTLWKVFAKSQRAVDLSRGNHAYLEVNFLLIGKTHGHKLRSMQGN